ncbi:MAG TPA: hypothetical protein VE891_14700 [Allosphingosinicella sp.]|nr:hypothetical protein [Allosphingosinicella sp.]
MILYLRVLEKDGGEDQDLAGDGDDARRAGFHDTHFNFLMNESLSAPAALYRQQVNYSQLQK